MDFASADPTIEDARTIGKYFNQALDYQEDEHCCYFLDRRTTPSEAHLKDFPTDLEKVDRLYYIHHGSKNFRLIARLEQSVYIEIKAYCSYWNMRRFRIWGGVIFISSDANVFMKLVLADLNDSVMDRICDLLRLDGIYV